MFANTQWRNIVSCAISNKQIKEGRPHWLGQVWHAFCIPIPTGQIQPFHALVSSHPDTQSTLYHLFSTHKAFPTPRKVWKLTGDVWFQRGHGTRLAERQCCLWPDTQPPHPPLFANLAWILTWMSVTGFLCSYPSWSDTAFSCLSVVINTHHI